MECHKIQWSLVPPHCSALMVSYELFVQHLSVVPNNNIIIATFAKYFFLFPHYRQLVLMMLGLMPSMMMMMLGLRLLSALRDPVQTGSLLPQYHLQHHQHPQHHHCQQRYQHHHLQQQQQ